MDKRILEDLISVTTKSSDKNTIFKVSNYTYIKQVMYLIELMDSKLNCKKLFLVLDLG